VRTHLLARRYARALYELALERNCLDIVAKEIESFSILLNRNARLRAYLFSPQVEKRRKMGIMDELTKTRFSSLMHNFLALLVRKGRQGFINEIAFEFGRLLDKKRKRIRATITTVISLSSGSIEKLKQTLAQALNAEVVLESKVDPSILGGLIVNLDGKVVDGSIRHQLQRLAKFLKNENLERQI